MRRYSPAWQRYNEAQQKFNLADQAHTEMLNKYFPGYEVVPGEPIKTDAVTSLLAFDEIVAAIEQFKEAQERLERALRAVQRENGFVYRSKQ